MKVIFWQNILSPHQAGFMRGFAERGHDVTVVAEQRMSAGRQRLGWEPPALGSAKLVVGPSRADVRQIVCESDRETIHCIAGARVNWLGSLVAKECRAARRRMGIISETPDPRGPGGMLRWGKYAWERLFIGRHFDFVMAMGETGVRWFRRCGYPSDRVFPFCYVTQGIDVPPRDAVAGPARFLFVGRLVDLKGVDILLKAMASVSNVELNVIGDGPCLDALKKLAATLGISPRVRWLGQMNPAEVPLQLANADVLVLPSRKDGWGAVVNEALMLGTPVICSSACGASDLIRHDWLGAVTPAGDVPALQAAILKRSTRGRLVATERERIRAWAQCIASDSIAAFLENVFRHVYEGATRPVAPWRQLG